jgi:hypothetical protein
MNNFKDKLFTRCFDCGWGEKGVHDVNLSFNQMFAEIELYHSLSAANAWAESDDDYFEINNTHTIMSSELFDSSEWEGSQDY